jgi:hypothetical protein
MSDDLNPIVTFREINKAFNKNEAVMEAIAKLLGTKWTLPTSPPLILDGLLAFDEIQEKPMLPLSLTDSTTPAHGLSGSERSRF